MNVYKKSIGQQILRLFVVAYLVILGVSYVTLRSRAEKDVLSALNDQYLNHLHTTARDITMIFDDIKADLRTLADNPLVTVADDRLFTAFLEADPDTFSYDYSPAEREIIELFSTYRAHHVSVNSVYMGRSNGSFVRSHPRASPTRYDPRTRPWYTEALEKVGSVVLTEPYESVTSEDVNIGTVMALVNKNGKIYGVIGMDVTLNFLSEHLNKMRLPFGGYLELWDKAGVVLISRHPERISEKNDITGFSDTAENRFSRAEASQDSYRFMFRMSNPEAYLTAYVPLAPIRSHLWSVILARGWSITLELVVLFIVIYFFIRFYILKPLHNIGSALIKSTNSESPVHIAVAASGELAEFQLQYNQLVDTIDRETIELKKTKFLIITSLASLAQKRDNETGLHIMRTQKYMDLVASAWNQLYPEDALEANRVTLMVLCAPLHDIGKVAIPDSILLKPGKLTAEEFEVMKLHTVYGREAMEKGHVEIEDRQFMATALAIVTSHHERWDGKGYPTGLTSDSIPIEARFMALADVYDALTTERVYKEAFSHETSLQIIQEGRGSQFDPRVVDAFLSVEYAFREIAMLYTDTGAH